MRLLKKTLDLSSEIAKKKEEVADLLESHRKKVPLPIYCSGDLRDSGYKAGVIDTNLFPAGFNNLCGSDKTNAASIFRKQIFSQIGEHVKSIAIIPEAFTANKFYLENVFTLKTILEGAGFSVVVSFPTPIPGGKRILKTAKNHDLEIIQGDRRGGEFFAGDFIPDFILLNNDFTLAIPEALKDIRQPILPSPRLGWHKRKKHLHFQYYNQLATELAKLLGFDPWTITIQSKLVQPVNFAEQQGIEQVAEVAETILGEIGAKHKEYGITDPPYLIVKNNTGTYGLGVLTIHSGEELLMLNRKGRDEMSRGKEGALITEVLVQEGIPTSQLIQNFVGEPVLYAIGCRVIGGFIRIHSEKSDRESLNVPGSEFRPFCLTAPDAKCECLKYPELLDVYSILMRLAILATGYEIQDLLK